MQEDQLCALPSTDDSEGTAYAGQENMFLGRSNNGLLCCSQTESRFTMESDSGRLLIWREQRTRYHQSNTVERHSYRGGGILVWAGISLGGHTDLHEFHGGTVTGLRYRDETLDPYVRPYAAALLGAIFPPGTDELQTALKYTFHMHNTNDSQARFKVEPIIDLVDSEDPFKIARTFKTSSGHLTHQEVLFDVSECIYEDGYTLEFIDRAYIRRFQIWGGHWSFHKSIIFSPSHEDRLYDVSLGRQVLTSQNRKYVAITPLNRRIYCFRMIT
ncbi:transposable element Tcb2 transposase [Trichonephila clavipes]|nr:transposable element Tcb2 transposase [Trichonephila clavipes]